MEALHPDVSEVILSEEDIKSIVSRMGAEITRDYKDKNPLLVTVLKGAVIFTADIMRAIECPVAVDFMAVSSYGDGVKSSGVVRILKDLDAKIEGRDVLIVEDILDSGITLSYLIKMLESRNPKSVKVAAFLAQTLSLKKLGSLLGACSDCLGTMLALLFSFLLLILVSIILLLSFSATI